MTRPNPAGPGGKRYGVEEPNMTWPEIADKLGISVSMAKKEHARAIRKIRALLYGEGWIPEQDEEEAE